MIHLSWLMESPLGREGVTVQDDMVAVPISGTMGFIFLSFAIVKGDPEKVSVSGTLFKEENKLVT